MADAGKDTNTGVGSNMSFMLIQHCMSLGGNFCLCDAMADGLPMRYVSPGFVDLFGYDVKDLVGRPCDAVVGVNSQTSCLTSLAEDSGLTLRQALVALDLNKARLADKVKSLMTRPHKEDVHVFEHAVNKKQNGALLVVEFSMIRRQHPTTGWSYVVGIQTDITDTVSVAEFLGIVLSGEYDEFNRTREAVCMTRLGLLGVSSCVGRDYLHEKALDMWWQTLQPACDQDDKAPVRQVPPVVAGVSTASGEDVNSDEQRCEPCSPQVPRTTKSIFKDIDGRAFSTKSPNSSARSYNSIVDTVLHEIDCVILQKGMVGGFFGRSTLLEVQHLKRHILARETESQRRAAACDVMRRLHEIIVAPLAFELYQSAGALKHRCHMHRFIWDVHRDAEDAEDLIRAATWQDIRLAYWALTCIDEPFPRFVVQRVAVFLGSSAWGTRRRVSLPPARLATTLRTAETLREQLVGC